MSKKTGGPAFPTNETHYEGEYAGQGLTMRDYFAAKAMQGYISYMGCENAKVLALSAYKFADAMIAEREKDSERRT